eukprot:1282711-Amphidinium_carterae.1
MYYAVRRYNDVWYYVISHGSRASSTSSRTSSQSISSSRAGLTLALPSQLSTTCGTYPFGPN